MTLTLIHYSATDLHEQQLTSADETQPFIDQPGVLWVHMQGLDDHQTVERLGELFRLHPLALEDVLNGPQRPKAEEYDEQDFVITHTVSENGSTGRLQFHQFSMFVGSNYVLTFQGGSDDITTEVRTRLRTARGLIRQHGVDHLMYTLLDGIIDGYFPVLEQFGEDLERVQEEALVRDTPQTLRDIQRAKHDLLHLRRVVWPQRDLLNVLMRDDNNNVSTPVRHYLRDCYDHVVQLMDMIETYREMASDLMDAYMSAISNRMNSIVKVLTIFSTVFLPLTFIAGVYGMNFDWAEGNMPLNMPELHHRLGYVILWGAMVAIALGMLLYFHWRGWIGRPDVPTERDLQCDEETDAPPSCRRR